MSGGDLDHAASELHDSGCSHPERTLRWYTDLSLPEAISALGPWTVGAHIFGDGLERRPTRWSSGKGVVVRGVKPRPKGKCSGCGKALWSVADARLGHHGGPCSPERRGPTGPPPTGAELHKTMRGER